MKSKIKKLKYRILLGYSLPIIISLGVSIIVYFKAQELLTQKELVDQAYLINENIKELAFDVQAMQRTSRGYLLEKNLTSLLAYQSAANDFDELAASLKNLVTDREQQDNLKNIVALSNQIKQSNNQLIALVDQNKVEQAIEQWRTGGFRELAQQLKNNVEEFERREKEILEARQQKQTAGIEDLTNLVILTALVSAVIAIALSLRISGGISRSIANTAAEVVNCTNDINASMKEQKNITTSQSTSVNQTSITLDELKASSQQATEQAEDAVANAYHVLTLVGGETKHQDYSVGDTGANLQEKVQQISQQITHLTDQVHQINQMASLVSDIANQTNMLALNASVEAVRAGKRGKGFGVVAGEIKKLADQSRKTAEDINQMVYKIHEATNTTVMVTQEGSKTVELVVSAVNQIVVNNQQISLSAQQQETAIGQIVNTMATVKQGAHETSEGITQVTQVTERLDQAAKDLEHLV
jgi:methyl-accepting chemotaxis protein